MANTTASLSFTEPAEKESTPQNDSGLATPVTTRKSNSGSGERDPLITGFEFGGEGNERWVYCPHCEQRANVSIVPHLKRHHPEVWAAFCERFAVYRRQGLSYQQIMWKFGRLFSWTVISRALSESGQDRPPPRNVRLTAPLGPSSSDDERPISTVWTFPQRGTWGVHDSRYRGNWAPQIPRNLILRYTQPGDVVVDPFVGGGTTALESYVLGRRFIGYDINDAAIEQTRRKLDKLQQLINARLPLDPELRPGKVTLICGDARSMGAIRSESVQLICAHPPYLNSIRYTHGISGDLSALKDPIEFCAELGKVARECLRILKPNGFCAVLIGDVRRDGTFIDLGFQVKKIFIDVGFQVYENIVKTQHKARETMFWQSRKRKIEQNGATPDKTRHLLLIAHEYLFIFRKPSVQSSQR